MILDDACAICTELKPRASAFASFHQLRYIEYRTSEEESYNYDINGIPYFILENAEGAIISKGGGGLGLTTIEKQLQE